MRENVKRAKRLKLIFCGTKLASRRKWLGTPWQWWTLTVCWTKCTRACVRASLEVARYRSTLRERREERERAMRTMGTSKVIGKVVGETRMKASIPWTEMNNGRAAVIHWSDENGKQEPIAGAHCITYALPIQIQKLCSLKGVYSTSIHSRRPSTARPHNDDSNFHKRNLITFYFHEFSSDRARQYVCVCHYVNAIISMNVESKRRETEREREIEYEEREWMALCARKSIRFFSFVPVRPQDHSDAPTGDLCVIR